VTKSRDAQWVVTHYEADGSPYIPTVGNPTSAFDLYRAVAIHTTGHEGWNSCIVDPQTCSAVARLVEGEVRSFRDLEDAELGLQALFWHDRADVIVAGFKARFERFSQYRRTADPRSELAFELFRPLAAFDQIYATEKVHVEERRVVGSNQSGSTVVGRTLDELSETYLDISEVQRAAISALPFEMSVPAYFVDRRLSGEAGLETFFSTLYDSIAQGWRDATQVVPSTVFAIRMPPLVSVVLNRADTRSTIPEAISELREETTAVREEMLQLSEFVRGARDQAAIERKYGELQRVFEAIVPASRYTDPPLLLPLLQMYKVVKSPLDFLMAVLSPSGSRRILALLPIAPSPAAYSRACYGQTQCTRSPRTSSPTRRSAISSPMYTNERPPPNKELLLRGLPAWRGLKTCASWVDSARRSSLPCC
jgi:hypothetical protein